MSAATLPDATAAYNTLFENIHAKVFLNKCAAAGYVPRSREEAQYMLDTGGKLRTISEHAQVKQAAAEDNPFYRMSSGLDGVMAELGLSGHQKQASVAEAEASYKSAADHLAQDPALYNAVLALKVDEAQHLKAEYDAQRARR